jgi:hypothetical protein
MSLSQKELKKYLYFDGRKFIWKVRPNPTVNKGDVAGSYKKGYINIQLKGKSYRAQRLVWLYYYGYFPEKYLDHINKNTMDNRLSNLREVDHVKNGQNRGLNSNSTSGVTGVYLCYKSMNWVAHIMVKGKTKYLGSYEKFIDAVKARYAEEVKLGWLSCHSETKMGSAYNYLKRENYFD